MVRFGAALISFAGEVCGGRKLQDFNSTRNSTYGVELCTSKHFCCEQGGAKQCR